jgi:hypothetical protein
MSDGHAAAARRVPSISMPLSPVPLAAPAAAVSDWPAASQFGIIGRLRGRPTQLRAKRHQLVTAPPLRGSSVSQEYRLYDS